MVTHIASAPITFRVAQAADAPVATALINAAYRGDSSTVGWTTEAHILEGRRIDEAGLVQLMTEPDSLILLCHLGDELIGSVHLQKRANRLGYLGMFVVRPDLQGCGLGRRFMREAETTAQRLWGVTRMALTVISLRRELIAFYERCGYALTGALQPFPFEDGLSTALVEGIELAMMEKQLPALVQHGHAMTSSSRGNYPPAF
ncbi:GNAT family N-acetyltransferase [Rhodoblastus acidophilus]|uniref:GNAT family N-acetyltransferase n=1 Tax=Candidatus Rhodoblastus alkanivorans TaxID=2954117 RepID=A0ABS9Z6G3_9HYPH|nr:GNAT family N-acetyltransferase [Candidatus Rhodoblastus alkanivorans]MCI4679675.1 GNAT family N-acetyltransferase [Candidatus Rhodoblastus alkanivorans]MCI4683263.1 GNAT family N-acetyltransferase [Candidatus Rhodoblastus alkanivorans]MDI4640575.1 GNAT family N-acetyltransferase [Rhodoblastus acidophilus]